MTEIPQQPTSEPVLVAPASELTPTKKNFREVLARNKIVLAIAIVIVVFSGGGVLFANARQTAPLPSPSPLIIPSPSPSPLLSPSPVASPSTKLIIVSPKPVNKYPYTLVSDYKDVTATGWNKTSEGGKDGPFGVRAHLTFLP